MPDGMLEDIDRRAAASGVSRSAFIQEAIAHYSAALDGERAIAERSERIRMGITKMREVAQHMPPGTDGTAIIRRFREARAAWVKPGARHSERLCGSRQLCRIQVVQQPGREQRR